MGMEDKWRNVHFREYIFTLKRRKWIVISFFVITVCSVSIATFLQPPIYRASATVIVDAESPEVLGVKDVVKLGETNYFAYRDYIQTQQEIIRSRRTAHYVLKRLKLLSIEKFRKEKDPVQFLLKKIKVELVRDTRILKISAEDEDPLLASRIANEFARIYAKSNLSLKINMSKEAQGWLAGEVEKQKRKLTESELKLQRYKEENDIVSIKNQEAMINDSLKKLNGDYLDAKAKRIRAETVYRALIDVKGNMTLENLPSVISENKTLQQLKDEYLKKEALLVEYKKTYKDKHPRMIKLLEGINYLKSHIRDEIEMEYKTSIEQENKFIQALEEQKKKALELEKKIISYNVLKREVDTNERMLQIVLNRLKETSIANQVQANNVRVQDLAEVPKKPVRPRKKLNIALAVIIGLTGGAGLAFFRDYMDTTIKEPVEAGEIVGAPVLGSVPRLRRDGRLVKKKEDIDRVVEKDTSSIAAEAYRTIRTNLLFSINHSSAPKSIVITSSIPREGKTITAVNLSIMIASSGEKVLLVDADMRKPRIHNIFHEPQEPGLSNFLKNETGLEDIIRPSGIDNLSVVYSGRPTSNSAELLGSGGMKNFIDTACRMYSKIIFDTPPVSLVTDAQILSSMTTAVILVVEGGKSTRGLLTRSKDLLAAVHANVAGVVLNNIRPSGDIYSYPQYYYGKYYNISAKA